MADDRLPSQATLAHLTGLRSHRTEFVRRVVANFYASKVDRTKTHVRIGIQGSGKRPNYRLESPTPIDGAGAALNLTAMLIFNGANHETMTTFEADRAQDDTWSTDKMSFASVEMLLGELRKIGSY